MTRILLPMPARDRMLRGVNMTIVVGPLRDLNRDQFVQALLTLAKRGPAARVGYTYADAHTWAYDPADLADLCEQMVGTFAPSTEARAAEYATEVGQHTTGLPLQFWLSDEYMIVNYHHALGDAQAAYGLIDAIFALLRGEETRWGLTDETRRPTLTACRNFFTGLTKIRTAYTAKRYGRDAAAAGVERETQRSGKLVYEIIDTDTTRALNAAARKANASIMAVLFDGIHRQLAAHGVPLNTISATYDLRRYLPENTHVGGNLIAALPFSPTALTSPAALTAEQENNTQSGLPLLASAVGVSRTGVFARRSKPVTHARYMPGRGARLLFSGMGVVRAIERLPWNATAERKAFYAAYIHPNDANEIMINIIKVKNRLIISTCFFPEVYDEVVVRSAIQAVAANPTRYLQEATPTYYVGEVVQAKPATMA